MSVEIWIVFTGTVFIFMLTPGPSHLLMISNSLRHGWQRSYATALGDLSANFLQMIAAALGLAGAIQSSQQAFVWIKWAGVVWLVYLGLRLFFKRADSTPGSSPEINRKSLYLQGFITSAANPKAVIFFAALFPQFIDPSQPLLPQFAVLSTSYLLIDGSFLALYGRFASALAQRLQDTASSRLNQMSGGLFILAAVMLGLKEISPRS